jgi:hypothetical protein
VVASPRYDRLREGVSALRAQTHERQSATRKPRVLWAGQPETDDCMKTLAIVLPVLRSAAIELLFKAHPRDPGYLSGEYRAVLDASGGEYRDVTGCSVQTVLDTAPDLVVTQFSSVAIEAGFYGIPALWVLLAEAGGARLWQKKAYRVPPICEAGAAAYVTDHAAFAPLFTRALTATDFRMNLMRSFDDYLQVHERGTRQVAAKLLALK